jgi:hypothetical protein
VLVPLKLMSLNDSSLDPKQNINAILILKKHYHIFTHISFWFCITKAMSGSIAMKFKS